MSPSSPQRRPTTVLRPDRLRVIERPFGWLPCRLLGGGWLEAMSGPAKLLYLLLAAAADRQGLSFYSDARVEHVLALGDGELTRAREELAELDLLAFDGRFYQLLSLPHHPPGPASPTQQRTASPGPPDPLPVVSTPASSGPLPEDVQAILHKLLG